MKIFLMSILVLILGFSCKGNRKNLVEPADISIDPSLIADDSGAGDDEGDRAADPLFKEQVYAEKIGLTKIWDRGETSGTRRIVVALLSTGVDYNHEDLRSNIYVNKVESELNLPSDTTPADLVDDDKNGYVDDIVGYDVVSKDGYPYDRTGHGTAIAGVIGALHNNGKGIRGITGKVSILPVRYIDENGLTTVPWLIQGLKYALSMNVDQIVLHLANVNVAKGGEIAEFEKEGIQNVLNSIQEKQIPIFISAGNTGEDIGTPNKLIYKVFKKFENVVFVTSVDINDQRPFIANFGMQTVATSAPGVSVVTTVPANKYRKETGTYLAAAHISGTFALAQSIYFGKVSNKDMIKALTAPEASDSLSGRETLETIGGNRLNVEKYLNYIAQ